MRRNASMRAFTSFGCSSMTWCDARGTVPLAARAGRRAPPATPSARAARGRPPRRGAAAPRAAARARELVGGRQRAAGRRDTCIVGLVRRARLREQLAVGLARRRVERELLEPTVQQRREQLERAERQPEERSRRLAAGARPRRRARSTGRGSSLSSRVAAQRSAAWRRRMAEQREVPQLLPLDLLEDERERGQVLVDAVAIPAARFFGAAGEEVEGEHTVRRGEVLRLRAPLLVRAPNRG